MALYLIDMMSFKSCELEAKRNFSQQSIEQKTQLLDTLRSIETNFCSSELDVHVKTNLEMFFFFFNFSDFKFVASFTKACLSYGAKCLVTVDAFYFLTAFLLGFGVLWLYYNRSTMNELQSLTKGNWRATSARIKNIPKSFSPNQF